MISDAMIGAIRQFDFAEIRCKLLIINGRVCATSHNIDYVTCENFAGRANCKRTRPRHRPSPIGPTSAYVLS